MVNIQKGWNTNYYVNTRHCTRYLHHNHTAHSELGVEHSEQRVTQHSEKRMDEHSEQRLAEHSEQGVAEPSEQRVSEHSEQRVSEHSEQRVAEHSEQRVAEHSEQMVVVHSSLGMAEQEHPGPGLFSLTQLYSYQDRAIILGKLISR